MSSFCYYNRILAYLYKGMTNFVTDGLIAFAVALNVKDPDSINRMVDMVIDKNGHIDILVNNAGIVDTTPMLDLSVEAWDNLIDINLRGMQLCTQACLRKMIH
jgi:NAD(P)-dependent dehydrogenase (short-subunit alcohol dehydrogenase family)